MYSTQIRIPDIEAKFEAIKKSGTPFYFLDVLKAPGGGKPSAFNYHHQGIWKLDGNGNYIITGNVGKDSAHKPYFYVIRNYSGAKCFDGKDHYSIVPEVKGDANPRRFTHPGGIQVAENVLAIVLEDLDNKNSWIVFYDISGIPDETGPATVKEIENWSFLRPGKKKGEAIGLIKHGGRWIIVVNTHPDYMFYATETDKIGADEFKPIGSVKASTSTKSNGLEEYQHLNFYEDQNGELYLFGLCYGPGDHDDKCGLHKVVLHDNSVDVSFVTSRHLHYAENGARLCYAAGVYYNGSHLSVYCTEAHITTKNAEVPGRIYCCKWSDNE